MAGFHGEIRGIRGLVRSEYSMGSAFWRLIALWLQIGFTCSAQLADVYREVGSCNVFLAQKER